MSTVKYQFADTDLAAKRLKYLAEVYAASSQEFILRSLRNRPQLALDLGCGPGYSTHMLAEATHAGKIVGLDNSDRFISLAREGETDRISFQLHDVTVVPFPVGPANFLFCRLLLTHLREPRKVIRNWASQMVHNGLLLLEEVEWIETSHQVFSRYLGIVEALLADQSTQLCVGPTLEKMDISDGLEKVTSSVARIGVSNLQAATMFTLNIQSWKNKPFIQANYGEQEIGALERELEAIASGGGGTTQIEWGFRQIVLQKDGCQASSVSTGRTTTW